MAMVARTPFFLVLLCLAAAAQSPELLALGGPCLAERLDDLPQPQLWHAMVSRHGQVSRQSDRQRALELAQEIVRTNCSNEHWWLKLAEELFELGREDQALAALDALYGRESNAVERRLRDPASPLNRLRGTAAYRRSKLAANLARDRVAIDQRRAEARTRLATEPRPPANYVAEHACPFECCRFGAWSVGEDTALYDRPGGTLPVGMAQKGTHVQALTGEVHLRPLPVRVRYPSLQGFTAEEGSIVFLLDYHGEGVGHVWVKGKVVEADVLFSVDEQCAFASASCWGEFVDPDDAGRQRDGTWWVHLKTPGGADGWTQQTSHFGEMDGCG